MAVELDLLGVSEVARALGLSRRRVQQLLDADQISHVRTVGGWRLVPGAEVRRVQQRRPAGHKYFRWTDEEAGGIPAR